MDRGAPRVETLTERDIAQRTFRYVRLAVIGAVGMLAVAIGIELATVGVLRTSISSYYWTPANAVFVASLVTCGICLVAIQGSTPTEDVLLNLAGALAPIVAFVPITDPHEPSSAPSVPVNFAENVGNNVSAYLISGVAIAVAAWWIVVRSAQGSLSTGQWLGFAALAAGIIGGTGWFVANRTGFERYAHGVSAVTMFVMLLAVMVVNAVSFGRQPGVTGAMGRPAVNRYLIVAIVTGGLAGIAAIVWASGVDVAMFWLEAVVIVGFVIFWLLQTQEVWSTSAGVREDPRGVLPPATSESA